jgi:metal-responsive CopG/Arc/MetJ family transcriptional regulator
MKTAISIPDNIYKEVERIAREHNYSRSEVFVIAVKEFLERLKSKEILHGLNEAYSSDETAEETDLRVKRKEYYGSKIAKGKH